jgi:hypothetical protein
VLFTQCSYRKTVISTVSLVCAAFGLNCQASSIPSLASAANYAVLGLANTNINNSLVTINGNEGVSAGGSLTNMAPSVVNGNVYQAAAGLYTGPGTVHGSVITAPTTLAQNDSDAAAAVSAAELLTATQTYNSGIGSDTTVTGNGGLNVIAINGDITKSLMLSGSAKDTFVVLVSGNVSLVGSDALGLGGQVTSNNVLYVFTGTDNVATHVGNTIDGTMLGLNTSFNLDGTFNGEIIGGGSSGITLMSGAVVNNVPFTPPACVPEPSTMALLGPGLVVAGTVFRKRIRRAAA